MLRFLFILFIALMFFSCSKATVTGVDSNAAKTVVLTSPEVWNVFSVGKEDTIKFRVHTQANQAYVIQWDDSLIGSGTYTAVVNALALDSAGTIAYWYAPKDTGYPTGAAVYVTDSNLVIRVTGLSAGKFAIRVLVQDSIPTSSCSVVSSSSSILNSSSSTSSSSALIESSSSILTGGTILSISPVWTMGHLNLQDTMTYVVAVTPGTAYHVQWMDQYDYNYAELSGGAYPNCDVIVSAWDGNGTKGNILMNQLDDGYTIPISVVAANSVMTIKVVPHYALLDSGTYYLRVYANTHTLKSLPLSSAWTVDSTALIGDTISYTVPTLYGTQYEIQWDDAGDGSGKYSNDVSVLASNSSAFPITTAVGDVFFFNNYMWTSSGYTVPMIYAASSTQTVVNVLATKTGKFALRIFPYTHLKAKVLQPSTTFMLDTLKALDTIVYSVPTTIGKHYYFSANDYSNGTGIATASVYLSEKDKASALWSSAYTWTYSYPISVLATSDTTLIRITGYSTYQQGTFGLRAMEKITNHQENLKATTSWHLDTLIAGDTFTYKVPVIKDSIYRIQWDDHDQGSGSYTGSVDMYYQDNTASTWTGEYLTGYSDKNLVKAGGDTLYVRFTGKSLSAAGTFAVRVFHPGKVLKDMPLSTQWLVDTLNLSDTILYRVPTTAGTSYRIQWEDNGESFYSLAYSANVSIKVMNKAGTSYGSGFLANGYSELDTLTAKEDSILVVVVGAYTTTVGNFAIRTYPTSLLNNVTVLQPSSSWTSDSLMGGDVVMQKIPVTQGQDYLIQIDDEGGSGTYNGLVQMSCANSKGVVYKSESSDKYTLGMLVSPTEDTLYLTVAPSQINGGGTYGIRAQEFVAPLLVPTFGQSLPMSVQTFFTAASQVLTYRVDVTPGQTYDVRWASYYDPYGGSFASATVNVYVYDTKTTLLGPYSSGYTSPPSFASTQDHVYIDVLAVSAGTFMLGVGVP